MHDLLNKLAEDKVSALIAVTPLNYYQERYPLFVHPDSSHTYDGDSYKEYFCRDDVMLSESFKYIVASDLLDYGYVNPSMEIDMLREVSSDGCGRLDFHLGATDFRKRLISVEGTLYGDGFVISNPDLSVEAELRILGVKAGQPLSLFEELLLEAFCLEREENHRVSFFIYFTALEALITQSLEKYRASIHDELWNALEHLSIDEKLRIVVKEAFNTKDLNSINSWSCFAGTLRDMKEKRNKIAHGQALVKIDDEDLTKMFSILTGLHCYVEKKIGDFIGIRKYLYPRRKRSS